MLMEDIESRLISIGYKQEDVDRIKEVAMNVANSVALTFREIIESFMEIISSCWEEIKEKLNGLANRIRELLDIQDKKELKTKQYISYNPPSGKEWYNQYCRSTMQDTRSTIKHFTIYKSGGRG